MKTDVIKILPSGEGVDKALLETEKAAAYCGLGSKPALRLRLLAEEMTGMLRTIVGEGEYLYWIESNGNEFTLHLRTEVQVDREAYDELIKAASSGRNDAAKGFMGRVRDMFLRMSHTGAFAPNEFGCAYVDPCGCDPTLYYPTAALYEGWSMKAYREQLEEHRDERPEQWDELEKSITANLADEVKVFIRGNSVELIVEKKFE